MERSAISNSVNTSITTSEESSWTTYFEYFLASEQKKRGEVASSSLSLSSDNDDDAAGNSVVSDAASCARELPLLGVAHAALPRGCVNNVKVKKKRVRGLLDEDPLEDTASSPVNSPKVGYIQILFHIYISLIIFDIYHVIRCCSIASIHFEN